MERSYNLRCLFRHSCLATFSVRERIKMKRVLGLSFIIAVFTLLLATSLYRANASVKKASQNDAPTFSNQVVRIFQKNCQVCHHPGDIAPFSLLTYRDARPWARSIQEKVVTRQMPPWKPTTDCGDFDGERRLNDDEISLISQWVDAGSPEGNAADLPEPLNFPDGWTLGTPDVIVQPDQDYSINPGNDIY